MLTFLSFNHFERKIIKIVNLNLNKIKILNFKLILSRDKDLFDVRRFIDELAGRSNLRCVAVRHKCVVSWVENYRVFFSDWAFALSNPAVSLIES